MPWGVAEVEAAAEALRRATGGDVEVAVVLGSGLGRGLPGLVDLEEVACNDLPHWPVPAVEGHPGTVVTGLFAARRVAVLCGRVHAYEGHAAPALAFPLRVMRRLGAAEALLVSAAGGIDPALGPGDLMIVDDHISLAGNPLLGPNDERFGPRFPDMSEVYSRRLRQLADDAARALGVAVRHGVYAGVTGPSYETPAEVRALRTLGADVVGMSMTHEAVVARHLAMDVLGVTVVANPAAGTTPARLSHTEVLAAAASARDRLGALLEGVIERL